MRLLPVVAIPCAKVKVFGYPKVKNEALEAAEVLVGQAYLLFMPYGGSLRKGR
jgi:hypothetical protein